MAGFLMLTLLFLDFLHNRHTTNYQQSLILAREDAMSRFVSAAFCALFMMSFSLTDVSAATGKAVYDANCTACHKDGIMGAPKTGNKPAWAPRIAQGMTVLVDKSIKGYQGKKGMMPAKGGNTKLSNADVKLAVEYMVSLSK